VFREGSLRNFALEMIHRDGHVRSVLYNASTFTNAAGKVIGILAAARDITERKRSEEAVRLLAGKLLTAQEEERRRLAREMHDDLTQRIAVLAIEAGRLEHELDCAGEAPGRLREMREQLIDLSKDVHGLSRQLHPAILDDLGLADALRSECARFSQREKTAVHCELGQVPQEIPRDVALCLYRIAQEALRNIAKHADAEQATVSLAASDDGILLSIEDTGSGFDRSQHRGQGGVGLASMEERARLMGGDLSIHSEPGKGTLIEVWAPLSTDQS
jgi:signal transduction histidine kinase